ncbi:Uncharacterised protein [Nocardia brasiliensis]|nr:Uncharacterised protein [Nocardia brasiliensis]
MASVMFELSGGLTVMTDKAAGSAMAADGYRRVH